MNNSSDVRRVNRHCVDAVEDIIKKVKLAGQTKGLELSFSNGSWILGEKYFRGQLSVISFDEIKKKYGRNRKGWFKEAV